MSPNEIIETVAARVVARGPCSDTERWEWVAEEYERLTGDPLNRTLPYHISLAAAAHHLATLRQL